MNLTGPGSSGTSARLALALVVALLSGLLAMGATSLGWASATVAQPSPSGSGSPTGPKEASVAFVNPSLLAEDDVPEVSDRPDGVDSDYHIVAWTQMTPPNAIVEVSIVPTLEGIPVGNEQTVGTLDPVPGRSDTWEFFWDVPSSYPEGDSLMTVRLFTETPLGFDEVASDEVAVTVEHEDNVVNGEPTDYSGNTTELTWPTQNGPIGWFKARGGAWRAYVDYTQSATGASEPNFAYLEDVYYTTSDPGAPPEWKLCLDDGDPPRGTCTLAGTDRPSQITAMIAQIIECLDIFCFAIEPDSTDAHVVRPYLPDPHQMTIDLNFRTTTESPLAGRQLAGSRAPSGAEKCIAVQAVVKDQLDRPVLGANLDFHITGPNDQVQFGSEQNGPVFTENVNSTNKNPDKDGHSSEAGRNCDPVEDEPDDPRTAGEQGDHNVPVQDDVKHRESVAGSALDGGSGVPNGGWWTDIYSPSVGLTEITAWIDNEQIPNDSVNPEADDDVKEAGEPFDTLTAQWLPSAEGISVDPAGGSSPAGSCFKYTLKLRAGTTPVRNLNVDVHATGPNDDLDFCDPSDGNDRQAPDTASAAHDAEDADESSHAATTGPRQQHTEGEADEAGNFVFGVTSPVSGDTSLTAWIDGTKGSNNDVQGTAAAEPAVTFSHSWSSSTGDAEVSFINPSGYAGDAGAGGEEISAKDDGSAGYHIITRVDAPNSIQGIEVLLGQGGTFASLGQATRIGNTDSYELTWAVDVPDGDYTLRARILGTTIVEDRTVRVNNRTATAPPDEPANQQAEAAELTRPVAGTGAPFTDRITPMEGKASTGAEGVYFYYSKVPAKDTPTSTAWTQCGFTALDGTGSAVQNFQGKCTLTGADQPSQVTALAALTFDCLEPGGNAAPSTQTNPRCPGAFDSGDAHRVFGFEAAPLVSIEPAETATEVGSCQKLVMSVIDQTGQAVGNTNVDVHATGPGEEVDFCDPADGSAHDRSAPNDGGHEVTAGQEDQGGHEDAAGADQVHSEGTTTSAGRFVFGIASDQIGDTQLQAWVDRNENDAFDADEPSDTSVVHWEEDGGSGDGCDISGTAGPDTLTGTPAGERICGFAGDDTIRGNGGNDLILGAGGRDVLRGNGGNDRVKGGAGNDETLGGGGRDRTLGGGGDDTLRGHRGNDRLLGHGGRDALDGGPGRDACFGGKSRDRARNCEATRSVRARGFARRTSLI